ncbi:T9SS type A sorting domain-containing protein [Dokdonia sp.]|uniref:T9SS type A sorting domain-containing protein n=1 Tax=Dokdonia sp. TaxID=2024995 RepID=UPI00326443FA
MKKFISLVIICLCMVTTVNSQQTETPIERISQPFTYVYDIVLHIEDSITFNINGNVDVVQKYSLEFPKYTPRYKVFDLEDYVGFRIILKYDSSIPPIVPLDFGIEYLEDVDLSGAVPLVEGDNDPILGGLKPITIPPVEEEDDEDFPVETNEQRFVFNEIGNKYLYFNLFLNNSPTGRVLVSKLRGNFMVRNNTFPNSTAQSTHTPQVSDIDVFPNPLQSDLYIKNLTKDLNSKAKITIYNTTGVQLYTSPLTFGTQKQDGMQYQFQNPDLSPGLYYYVIHIGDKTYTKSLLKK